MRVKVTLRVLRFVGIPRTDCEAPSVTLWIWTSPFASAQALVPGAFAAAMEAAR